MSQRKFKRARQKTGKAEARPQPDRQPDRQPEVQALVWYKEEHWSTLKEMFVDGDMLPASFSDWLKRAEQMKTDAEAAGDAVIKVYIDPDTFPQWCEAKGLPMNSEARSQLAIEIAQARSFSL
jgi:hypothetical protein